MCRPGFTTAAPGMTLKFNLKLPAGASAICAGILATEHNRANLNRCIPSPGFGIYTIRQKISNACYADSIQGQILVQATGIQDLSLDESPDFFPNPVDKKEGIIRFKNVPEEVYLMDLRGSRIALKPENEILQLPKNLPSGAYQLHFNRKGKTAMSKKLLLIR